MNDYVLIVDDDFDARRLVARIVQKLGFEVTEAGNGQEALDIIEANPPALLILDLMMPQMSGFSVIDSLKASGRNIPLIIVTALGQNDAELHDRLPQDAAVLQKGSYDLSRLQEVINAQLQIT